MKAILDLLQNNAPLTAKLKTADSVESAAKMLAAASKERGQSVNVIELSAWLAQRPKSNPEGLSDDELQSVSGGALPKTSDICCFTCRTSKVLW